MRGFRIFATKKAKHLEREKSTRKIFSLFAVILLMNLYLNNILILFDLQNMFVCMFVHTSEY